VLENPEEIANCLNDCFIKNQISDNHEDGSELSQHASIMNIQSSQSTSFSFDFISDESTKKCLQKLNNKKSPGLDHVSPFFLKVAADALTIPLTDLFNHFVWTGSFPDDMKRSVIIPIFKKDNAQDPKNYRPVSLLSSISKVFESILLLQLNSHFESKLANDMFGFRSKRGCEHAIVELTEHCRRRLDLKECVAIMALDLSRAFDTVSHKLLLAKLKAYGLDESALRLIESYLSDRQQCTRVNNVLSQETKVIAGVPQGSIVGPLLFNIFVNDLSLFLNCTMVRYADDTTLIVSEPQPEDLKIEAESVLHDTFRWFTNNQLIINPSKTQLLLLGNKTKTDEWNNFAITVGDKVVYPSESLTLLGVTLDCKLSYEQHVSKKLKKAGYSLKLARNVNNITSTSQRQLLMSSYVLPHLIYCCSLFISLKQSQIKRVNHFFKVARRSLQLDASSTVPFEELCMRRGLSLLHQAFHTNVPLLFSANI
jgi:hypothetical protein